MFTRAIRSGTLIICVLLIFLGLGLVLPVYHLLFHSLTNAEAEFAGLTNFISFFATPGFTLALQHTLGVGLCVTVLTLLLAFFIAYGLTHTRMPAKNFINSLTMLSLCVPSLLPAIGIIYLFGEQGCLHDFLGESTIYGYPGIILGDIVFALPHAVLLLHTALSNIDKRQYDAAASLGAGKWRRFFSVTLPNSQYGLISAGSIVFILTISDFGVPKVVGGNFSMLATEIYTLVIGQHDFALGATTSLVLLCPTVFAVIFDMWARRKQDRLRSDIFDSFVCASFTRDLVFLFGCVLIYGIIFCILGIVVVASFLAFWPYDLTFTLDNYAFETVGFSYVSLYNSIIVAILTALFGTLLIVGGAYTLERLPALGLLKKIYRFLILLPLGLPGTALGLAYIFAFVDETTPWGFLYGSNALIVINCIVHFAAVTHLTAVTMLGKLNKNYELVGQSLGVPRARTFLTVIMPLCSPSIVNIALYFFICSMSTVSSVVFLCNFNTSLASVSIISMYDSGNLGSAAAMGTLILLITLSASFLSKLPSLARILHTHTHTHNTFSLYSLLHKKIRQTFKFFHL